MTTKTEAARTLHTPGPWLEREVNNARVRGALHIFAAGHPGSLICEDVYGKTLEEADANRKLIKSAPKLLAALKDAAAVLSMLTEPDVIQRTSVQTAWARAVVAGQQARAVIAEAEGGS